MNIKRFLQIAGVALLIYFVIAQPDKASSWVHILIDWLKWAGSQVIHFIGGVFSGR